VLVVLFALLLLAAMPVAAAGTPEYARQTDRPCTYCHRGPGGPLTAEGLAFREAGYRLPATEEAGSLLTLPAWSRTFLLWFHLVGMTAWLGAIIFVHVVQTPRVAGRGIPRGYFILAWPSIVLLGASGVLLTLGDIQDFSELVDSRWGTLLLVKIALYLMLLSVALAVTLVIGPRLRRLATMPAGRALPEHVRFAQEGLVTVGYEGRIYDVSSSRMWAGGRHMGKHEAWQDLTSAMAAAPHGPEVFKSFRVLTGGRVGTPRALRVFLILAYGNLGLVLATLLVVALWLTV
jgi:predicted heme/steroid binding protein